MKQLTHLSLFSGIGGLDLSAEWAGFTTVGQCEWADYPTKVLEKHWPDVERWRDIRTLTKENFYERTRLHTVDVISGGFPCQPFSVAGKQKGKGDDRYLWPEMLRVIRELAPSWVVGENVPGIIKLAGRTVCEDLEREGYAVTVFNFEAAAVGAPHRRERVFFVGERIMENPRDRRCKQSAILQEQPWRAESLGAGQDLPKRPASEVSTDVGNAKHNGPSPSEITRGTDSTSNQQQERQKKTSQSKRTGLPRSCGDVANATSKQSASECIASACAEEQGEFGRSGFKNNILPDANILRMERSGTEQQATRPNKYNWLHWRSTQSRLGGVADGLPSGLDGHWRVEPDIPRVAKGIKNRVDRLKCLGNAVVPQQAYPIFRAIAEIERSAE